MVNPSKLKSLEILDFEAFLSVSIIAETYVLLANSTLV